MSNTLLYYLQNRKEGIPPLLETWNKNYPYSPLIQLLVEYHHLSPLTPVRLLIDDKTKVYQFLNHLDLPFQFSELEAKTTLDVSNLGNHTDSVEPLQIEEEKIIKPIHSEPIHSEPIPPVLEEEILVEVEHPIIESEGTIEKVVPTLIIESEAKPVLNANSKASLVDWLKQTH